MNGRLRKYPFILAAALLTMLFSSCQGPQPIPEGNAEKLQELANAVVADLQWKILPNRETPENLVDYGYVLSQRDVSDGIDAITEFYMSYESGNDSEVTLVFADSSFVVAKVAFVDGVGYYLRYEYNKNKSDDFGITGELIDKVELKYQANPPKWEMTLKMKNRQVAVFNFKNPVQKEHRLQPEQ